MTRSIIRFLGVLVFVLTPITLTLTHLTNGVFLDYGGGVVVGFLGMLPFIGWVLEPRRVK